MIRAKAVILSDFTVQRYPGSRLSASIALLGVTRPNNEYEEPFYLYRVDTELKAGIIILAPSFVHTSR